MANIDTIQSHIAQATHSINNLSDNIKINRIVEGIITDVTGAEYASVWMHNSQILLRERCIGEVREVSMQLKRGLLYKCFATKESAIYNYLTSEKGYDVAIDNPDNIRLKSKIMIPLSDNGKFIGIVTAYSTIKKIKKFTKDDLNIFKAITPFVISAIYKMQTNLNGDATDEIRLNNDLVENLNEIKESKEDKKAPQEMLDYVSNIVHDIRTPANGLYGFLEILQEQIKDERLQEYINHAKSSASLINDLTTSILDDISERRKSNIQESCVVNTGKFFADIAEIFSSNMFKKQIDYNIFIDPFLPKEIELNCMKMKRVVLNLIGNAVKFTPVIVTSAYSDTKSKILAFKYGASDYMVKPLDLEELEARVWVQLSQNSEIKTQEEKSIFELKDSKVFFQQSALDLTTIEYEIMSILIKNKNQTIKRDDLVDALSSLSLHRSLDNHIKNIRKKIGDNGNKATYLKTEYGVGYKLSTY